MSASSTGPTAGLLVIGEEILSGKVADENSGFLARELRALGVEVRRIEVIPDIEAEITEAVRRFSQRFDLVFTSGGIGPTHDDVTWPAVAAAFDMRLVQRPELEQLVRASLGGEFHARDLRMALVPEGARLEYGVPPDLNRWPVIAVANVYVFPGIPLILRRKFDSVRELYRAGPIHGRAVYSRDGEGSIADTLDAVVAEFPSVAIGSYPRIDAADHKVKITLDGRDAAAVEDATARLIERLGAAVVRKE